MSSTIMAALPPRLRDRRYVLYGAGAGLVAYLLQRYAKHKKHKKHKKKVQLALSEFVPPKKDRVAVDRIFLERLRFLIKIVLPGIRSKEFALLGLHTTFLISRTLVSIYVAKLDGSIVKAIVDRKVNTFIMLMIKWLTIAIPATYINSMIHYLESKLSIAFRTRLVDYVYSQYMAKETYYRIGNLDSRLLNPDQCLTEDVTDFCNDLAHLYSHLSKPCLDIVLMTAQLLMLGRKRNDGKTSLLPSALATLVIFSTGFILKLATPPFGKLVAEQARRYGALRAAHSRVITHAEEIAFYGGHKVEEHVLKSTYASLVKHMNYIYRTRIGYTMLEQFLMRYVWGACGMVMIAIPTFRRITKAAENAGVVTPAVTQAASAAASAVASAAVTAGAAAATAVTEEEPSLAAISLTGALTAPVDSDLADTVSNRTQDFVTSRGLLISAADAIERMMSSWKEITELAGRTQRIHEMISIFSDVQEGKYIKKSDKDETPAPVPPTASPTNAISTTSDDSDSDVVLVDTQAQRAREAEAEKQRIRKAIANGVGKVIDNSSYIELVDVPVVTPDGDVLIHNPGLTFTIRPHMHLLITGPNGCGKSSLFRMIGGLWPVKGGLMRKPGKGDMFYIPQRPYLTTACLREQFIYPDTTEDMRAKGLTDVDLDVMLDVVHLRSVVERCGGMDSVKDWRDVLSGGEKQRVAMARLFYHKPRYAILDECTSAVSIDVEGRMYLYAKDIGITLLTVTHRPTLWKYHTHLLQFDGQGGYKFSELNADARLSLVDEKTKLEQSLAGIPKAQQRLKELCTLLGETSIHIQA